MFTVAELEAASRIVHAAMPPTPQFAWPLLKRRTGVDVVIKHENHTPTGAFKVRGGLVYVDRLKRERPDVKGVITATRGNHGQSLAFACARAGIACTVVVPFGNSVEKNAAMKAFGAELIEHGRDFDAARERAEAIAAERGYEYGKSFDRDLVLGVATYAYELFTAEPELDAVYVPIGLGSGICGVIAARDALARKAHVIGVVSDRANTYRLSLDAGRAVPTNSALTFADGMAVRIPDAEALDIIRRGMERLIEVTDDEIAEAIRLLYVDTHTLSEGAGAAAFAALMQERERMRGKRAAVIVSGQNIDRPWMQTVLTGGTPQVA
ncbi:MAG: threonine dehydratase [Hyphomicrobiales bacterium]|jgi:threonine dehydratase|nr:threonine dehydratase [Hyphomicrobiales bacterium]